MLVTALTLIFNPFRCRWVWIFWCFFRHGHRLPPACWQRRWNTRENPEKTGHFVYDRRVFGRLRQIWQENMPPVVTLN